MSDLENMQLNNAFPSALTKNKRRYKIAYKVSILEKLRSKTVSEIVKETNIPEDAIRDWIVAEESLGGQGGVEKIFFNHVCTVYSKYCIFYSFQNVLNIVFNQSLELITIMLKL